DIGCSKLCSMMIRAIGRFLLGTILPPPGSHHFRYQLFGPLVPPLGFARRGHVFQLARKAVGVFIDELGRQFDRASDGHILPCAGGDRPPSSCSAEVRTISSTALVARSNVSAS